MQTASVRRWSNVTSGAESSGGFTQRHRLQCSLTDVVIGLDLDNTLLDPSGSAYRNTVCEWLSSGPGKLGPDLSFNEYEKMREAADVLERLGFRNPNHDRGNPDALAAFCLTRGPAGPVLEALSVQIEDAPTIANRLAHLAVCDRSTRSGHPAERLAAEIGVRTAIAGDPQLRSFAEQAKRLANHPSIVAWSNKYREIENRQPVDGRTSFLDALHDRGANTVVVTEGRLTVQQSKLQRIGLASAMEGRLLVSESAARINGHAEFVTEIDRRLENAATSSTASVDPELQVLWPFECVRRDWARKTPSFFARCLHAIHKSADCPGAALTDLAIVPEATWSASPLRFVMVGDRYDIDVAPMIDLLGPRAGFTIRLLGGKYGGLFPCDKMPPERRPAHVCRNWDELRRFLTCDLQRKDIPPITAPPPVIPNAVLSPESVHRGLKSPLGFVRAVSSIASP